MARGRMIDKVIILSTKINAISEGAENLYYRIYVNTDDFGLFHANPKILKGQIYTLRNISVATIEKRLNELIEIGLLKVYENNGEKYIEVVDFEKHQTFRKDYVRKHEYPKPNTKSYKVVRSRTESPTNINKDKLIEIKEKIIDHFNKTTSQKRSYTCDETNKLINGRLDEGKTLNDFKHVIDTKTAQWLNDSKMRKFLRPSTLFRPANFEDYLNENYEDPKKAKIPGQVGVNRKKGGTKYPLAFIAGVYTELRKQGKEGHKYANYLFALTDKQATAAAVKYKGKPGKFIKFLEEKK